MRVARRLSLGPVCLVLLSTMVFASSVRADASGIAGSGYSASFSGESAFTNIDVGGTGQFSAIFFNDGTQAWSPRVVGLLVCAPDKVSCNVPSNASFNNGWLSPTVYATVSTLVAPGQNGFFVYNFTVPLGTRGGTATTFYGDVGLVASGALLRPQGYFQVNTTPVIGPAITPSAASVAIGEFQQFSITSAPPGSGVTWSLVGGCGALTSGGLFAATAVNSTSQPCDVLASIGASTLRASVTVYGAPTGMTCDVAPSAVAADGGSAEAGTAIARITLRDANGNLTANATAPQINVANVTPLLAQMNPVGLVSPSAGVVAVTITTTTIAGSIQVSASSPGFAGCNAIVASVGASTPSKTVATFSPISIAADGVSTSELSVDVTDAKGIRVATDYLTQISVAQMGGVGACAIIGFSRGSSPMIGSSNATITVFQGRATLIVRSTMTPGQCQYVVSPNNSSLTGTAAQLTTRFVGLASKLAVLSSDSPHPAAPVGNCGLQATNSDPSCTTIVVGVQDAQGLLATGDTGRTIYATVDPGSCIGAGGGDVVLRGSTATNGGRATFVFSSAGAYRTCAITFTTMNLLSVNGSVSWTPGTADHLACAITPAALPAGPSAAARADVTVRDVNGNVAPDGTYSVALARASGTATGLADPSPRYTTFGYATFTVVSRGVTGVDTYVPSLTLGSLRIGSTSCSISVQ